MEFLPVFLAARDRHVVIVGDGQMADAKCRGVLKTKKQTQHWSIDDTPIPIYAVLT